MADHIGVTFLLESLRSVMISNTDMIGEAKDELMRLENEVSLLRAMLHDTERNQAKELEKQIKELVYDVKDILESWPIYSEANNTTGTGCQDLFDNNNKVKSRLEREIKSIRHHRLDPMGRMLRVYTDLKLQRKQPTKPHQVPSVQLNREVPPIRLEKIVGLEDEAETLITSLLKGTEEVDVISITGMPGIGKTALAWKIYQNEKIRTEFPTRIWVDIPLDFCSKNLYLNILEELFKQGMASYDDLVTWLDIPQESRGKEIEILNEFTASGKISDHQLIHALHACLKQSRFLLVIDDVWTADTLESITSFLPNSGKVLTTSRTRTRSNRVTEKPHMLRFLNEKESWDLLQMEVFGKLDECPEILKSRGECIAKNCDGSPLAIVAVATSLGVMSSTVAAAYINEKWWQKVSENVILYITDYDEQRAFKSVELSYIKLTQCQQDCFLYLGVFPQGYEISVWTLLCLWNAERLVKEETAEETLNQLIDRNLVMVGKTYPNGQIRTCRLHKLMYGFCKYKAAEQGFYHEIKVPGGAIDSLVYLAPNHRRLCIYSHLSEFLSCAPNGGCVRSILCLNKDDKVVLHPKDGSTIRKCFDLLRVMEFKYVSFSKFPNELTKMMLLRYISLSFDDLDVIPETVTSLCHLETLVVDTQSPSLKLKANIWRMYQLRHLVTKAAITLAIRGAEGEACKFLQTLSRLAPESCTEDVFTRTPNLKTLGIRGRLAALSDANFLKRLEFVEKLKLINEPAAAPSEFNRLFRPDCFPPNLKRLTLSGTHLGWECMAILGKIDSLEILKLKNNAFTGDSWNSTDADGFGRLGFLLIGTTDLVSWVASTNCFPRLRCLVLNNCERLKKIPLTLAKSLDTLDVENVSESAKESAEEIEQEIARRQGQSSR